MLFDALTREAALQEWFAEFVELDSANHILLEHEPAWQRFRDAVAGLPELQPYLASDRRIAFNEDGIFRKYKALDG